MGYGKQGIDLRKFAATFVQSAWRRSRGPHPIRPSATFPSKAGEGMRPAASFATGVNLNGTARPPTLTPPHKGGGNAPARLFLPRVFDEPIELRLNLIHSPAFRAGPAPELAEIVDARDPVGAHRVGLVLRVLPAKALDLDDEVQRIRPAVVD